MFYIDIFFKKNQVIDAINYNVKRWTPLHPSLDLLLCGAGKFGYFNPPDIASIPPLLHLLCLEFRQRRRRIQPHKYKGQETGNNRPKSANPNPTTRDPPASWPLVMRVVSNSDFMFLFYVAEERSLVVDAEGENAMLVWDGEGGAVDGAVFGHRGCCEVETMEGREHGKFDLERIVIGDGKRRKGVDDVFRQFDVESLQAS
jgi:hypothetical protein